MGKTHAFMCVSFFRPPEQGTYTIGPQRKGDDKPCVTNVTIITFGTFSRQTSPYRYFCIRPEHRNVKWRISTKHSSNSPVTFVTHKRFAVLYFLPFS